VVLHGGVVPNLIQDAGQNEQAEVHLTYCKEQKYKVYTELVITAIVELFANGEKNVTRLMNCHHNDTSSPVVWFNERSLKHHYREDVMDIHHDNFRWWRYNRPTDIILSIVCQMEYIKISRILRHLFIYKPHSRISIFWLDHQV